jgi:hypothetical protein
MPANPMRLFLLGNGTQVSRPIVWIIGFFAFLNVYSIQAVLPMVMDDFHASPMEAGLTLCFKSKYWSTHQHVVASPSSQAADGDLCCGLLRLVLPGGSFHLCEPVPCGRPFPSFCRWLG